ncbi:MAG: arginine--tRNA ligase [Mariprofundaceae bacterium]|nr:arginine--tRNA ligase [Mariprofundaceae bacterium]
MKSTLEQALQEAVTKLLLNIDTNDTPRVHLTRSKADGHGDYACNIAMVLARCLKQKPSDIATNILFHVQWPAEVCKTEIAGPGFINIHLKAASEANILCSIVAQGVQYGNQHVTSPQKICIEFVSANPTGPMHVGHGRGAVLGDSLVRLLQTQGHDVQREYYINDAGGQIGVLACSVWARIKELQGQAVVFPEGGYPGLYIVDIAREILISHPFKTLLKMPENERMTLLADLAVSKNMTLIRADLARLNIHFDLFFSERQLHESGAVNTLIQRLQDDNLIFNGILPPPKGKSVSDYTPQVQPLFKTTSFGDDVDRPVIKQDGTPTYFAADIAYHYDKHGRGFDRMIDIWGADHGGYVTRVQAAVEALTGLQKQPDVLLVQMVNLTRNGQPVRMSKRAGTFVTLEEVVREVGADAVRFNFMTRRAETQFDFDLEQAKLQSNENPVYYVQYAHARIYAVLRKAEAMNVRRIAATDCDLSLLVAKSEQALIAQLLGYPGLLQKAADRLEPYRLTNYAMQLAAGFHTFYHQCRIIQDNTALVHARLLLAEAVAQVLHNTLNVLGVSAPEKM